MKIPTIAAVLAAPLALAIAAAPAAEANTRDSANSVMRTSYNVNVTPGSPYYFTADAGTLVWMNCWTRGPSALGTQKWFYITLRDGPRYGLTGYVPANAVDRQWDSAPLCPPW